MRLSYSDLFQLEATLFEIVEMCADSQQGVRYADIAAPPRL